MPNRKREDSSGIPGKPRPSDEDARASKLRRQEGTVNEHRDRVSRNNQRAPEDDEQPTSRHREHGKRR